MAKRIIKDKSLNDLIKKYNYSYKRGKIFYFTEKEVDNFKNKYGSYEYKGKTYKLNEEDSSLLNKNKTYYHIENKFYKVPSKANARNITLLSVLGVGVITLGTFGGLHLYNKINKVSTSIDGDKEVIEKTEVEVTKPAEVGQEYKATIKLKEEAATSKETFIPAKLNKVVTGGIELTEWHKEVSKVLKINNDTTEPDNYYTYTVNEDRNSGDLYIKKVLGPIVISYDLSHTQAVKITNEPTKLEYFVGDTFKLDGLAVQYQKPNDTTWYDVELSKCKTSIEDGYVFTESDVSNNKQVDVVYDNCAASFSIKVLAKSVTELNVVTNPSRMTFLVGERFDHTGIKVNAKDNTGATTDVTDSVTYSMGENDKFTEEDITSGKTITISYGGKSTSINVAVKMPYVLNIKKMPKTVYAVGDKLDLSGLELATSRSDEGLFSGKLDLSDCEITCDGDKITGDITFTSEDIGVIKEIGIKYKSLPIKNIFVAVPVECNGQADLDAKVITGQYNAFKLMDANDNKPYYFMSSKTVGTQTKDVMMVGENENVKVDTYFSAQIDYPYSNWAFQGFDIVFDTLTVVNEDVITNTVRGYAGFVGYNSAVYNKVKFVETCLLHWGCTAPDYEGDNLQIRSCFYDCEFNNTCDSEQYLLQTYTGTFEFYNTKFNAYSRVINIDRAMGADNYRVLFDNCSFTSKITRSQWFAEQKTAHGEDETYANGMISIKDAIPAIINMNNCSYQTYLDKDYDLITAKKNGNYLKNTDANSKVFVNGNLKTWELPKEKPTK